MIILAYYKKVSQKWIPSFKKARGWTPWVQPLFI